MRAYSSPRKGESRASRSNQGPVTTQPALPTPPARTHAIITRLRNDTTRNSGMSWRHMVNPYQYTYSRDLQSISGVVGLRMDSCGCNAKNATMSTRLHLVASGADSAPVVALDALPTNVQQTQQKGIPHFDSCNKIY